MNGEVFVGIILQASLIAIGLLMAIFSIILPSIKTILEVRFAEFIKLTDDLEKNVKNLKQSPKNINNKMSDMIFDLQNYKSPLPFKNYYVFSVILLYIFTVLASTYWFFLDANYQGGFLVIIGVVFVISTIMFGIIAYRTIKMIFKVIESISNDIYSKMQELKNEKEKLVKEFMDGFNKK